MSFTTQNLESYLREHDISAAVADYIRRAAAQVSRDVGTTTYRSVVCEYPSRKMGTSIVAESRTGEFSYVVLLEYDPNVIAYYEQPPAVDCVRTDRKGRRGARLYHPDFLVLRRSGPIVVQIKPLDKLVAKVADYPTDWQREGERFCDLPADIAFGKLGLLHEVVGINSLPQIRVANLQLLLQVRAKPSVCETLPRKEIFRVLDQHAALRISEVASQLGLIDLTPILAMIDEELICTSIDTMLLSQPDSCWVSRSASVLAAYVPREQLNGASLDQVPPLLQAQRAIEILARIDAGETGRSVRRYLKAIQDGAAQGQSALAAVTPKTYLSGNGEKKRPPHVLDAADEFVKIAWEEVRRLSPANCFRLYKAHALNKHPDTAAVSRVTLAAIIARHFQEAARARGGLRAGNAAESPTAVADRALRVTRPFELASCDHYLCDVHCVVLDDGKRTYTSLAWLTILRDCAHDILLGYSLSFRAPSRLACAMVLRSCLRMHGRLPEGIVVDRGAEFRSVYFAQLLAHCGIALLMRPSSHPRYGSEAERFFGEFKSQWLNFQPGNTAIHQESRSVSGSHAASAHAELRLCDLYQSIEQYSKWKENIVPNSGSRAPRVVFDQGLRQFPFSGREIPFDDNFRIASSIQEAKITIDPARGILIGDPKKWYWSLALAGVQKKSQLEVRRDPEDQTVVYARVDDRWHPCLHSSHALAQVTDPVIALCDSIISLTAIEARKKAKDDADIALITQVRLSNEQLRASPTPPNKPVPCDGSINDPFASLRDVDVVMPSTTSWEAP